ncbi:zinc ribbon domain-containing protein [Shewanella surugensis]|uniref:Zinc ribbon domain-containing protein n=1 Tax=Shewanella surugensis TaxID=212020 RepID=A0ABT0LHT5_9GAMM|nr:zinc ribbon domain-containing protein [Shewanella surugensis]MCL1127267.1 zinc ribbon domain-containing protein [Shewanella surugensis]
MVRIQCSQCQHPISNEVTTCPQCGHPNEQQPLPEVKRKVSWMLFLGIVFLPYIFVWFILRKGYKLTTQAIALGWLAFMLYTLTIEFYEIAYPQIVPEQQVISYEQTTQLNDATSHHY